MSRNKIPIALASLAALLLAASPVLAEDPAPRKFDRAEFCQQNPEKCEQMKQRRAERQAFCKENPQKCEEQRARMKQKRAEFKAKCEADPAKCEQMKQERRERWQKRHGGGAGAPKAEPPASEGAQPPPE